MLPVDVVFLHMRRSAAAESRIRARADELASLYPTLAGCRVIVDLPHRHHAVGKRFRVRIELALPRRDDLIVERGPAGRGDTAADEITARHKADEIDGAFADLPTVEHQAFAAAKRRLKTLVQRTRATARGRDAVAKRVAARPGRGRRRAAD